MVSPELLAHVSVLLGVVKTKGQFLKVDRVHETAFPGVMDQGSPRRAASIATPGVRPSFKLT